ncbi:MAG: hypothetical protein QW724_04740 [Nitrososphaerota archaeon]
MSRKKPRFLGEEYDIKLVQTPPPGPPEYELLNAWPRAPRSTRHNRESRTSIVISLLALIIAIFSMSPHLMSPFISTTNTTTVWLALMPTTTTTTYITTVTKTDTTEKTVTTTTTEYAGILFLPISSESTPECNQFQQNVRLLNLTFRYNTTHGLLSFIIDIPGLEKRVDENNFSMNVINYKIKIIESYPSEAENAHKAYKVSVDYRYKEPSIRVSFKIRENLTCPIIDLSYQK